MILGASGENVYPDELEEVYGDYAVIKELSIVGLPAQGGGETVAALVVPDYEAEAGGDREEIRERSASTCGRCRRGCRCTSGSRSCTCGTTTCPRPRPARSSGARSSTELERLERAAQAASRTRGRRRRRRPRATAAVVAPGARPRVAARDRGPGRAEARSSRSTSTRASTDLGFDSLMFTELGVALEAAGFALPDPGELSGLETVADLERLVAAAAVGRGRAEATRRAGARARGARARGRRPIRDEIRRAAAAGRARAAGPCAVGQKALYERMLDTAPDRQRVRAAVRRLHRGRQPRQPPRHGPGQARPGRERRRRWWRWPPRTTSSRTRSAGCTSRTSPTWCRWSATARCASRCGWPARCIRDGYILLIFPEGTRSESGVMTDFKPVARLPGPDQPLRHPADVSGRHPRRDAQGRATAQGAAPGSRPTIGPFMSLRRAPALTQGMGTAESYRRIATTCERRRAAAVPARPRVDPGAERARAGRGRGGGGAAGQRGGRQCR